MTERPHSAEFFDEFRDYWWNQDFLRLMSERLDLAAVRSVLDLGCGVGHWGRALAPVLPATATIVGIDREQAWVDQATTLAKRRPDGARYQYIQGDVETLPFGDCSFDLVTCQTLLIHVASPEKVLAEIFRVLKPAGKILLVEPNNLASMAILDSALLSAPVDDIVERFRFELICERGKAALGKGYLSIGDVLPGLVAKAGFRNVGVYLSDKASALIPPYETSEQQALIDQNERLAKKRYWSGSEDEMRRYFEAGGGNRGDFELQWNRLWATVTKFNEAVKEGTGHHGGGHVSYLVTATK